MEEYRDISTAISSFVKQYLECKQNDLELEVRVGCFGLNGFDPNISFESAVFVDSFLKLLRRQKGMAFRSYFTLKSTYQNGLRMISGDNAIDFKDMAFQRKTRVRNVDFECPSKGNVGLRVSLAREENVVVPPGDLQNFIPETIVLRNRQEFLEVVEVLGKSGVVLKTEIRFHITKVSPPQQSKPECCNLVCSYQIEIELGYVKTYEVLGVEVVSKLVGSILADRCMAILNINTKHPVNLFFLHKESS